MPLRRRYGGVFRRMPSQKPWGRRRSRKKSRSVRFRPKAGILSAVLKAQGELVLFIATVLLLGLEGASLPEHSAASVISDCWKGKDHAGMSIASRREQETRRQASITLRR